MLDLDDIKRLWDTDYLYNQTTRDRAADDLVFFWVTQWDDTILNGTNLNYRGQFDIIRKGGRDIMAELRQNEVQVSFEPKDQNRMDDADLLDGLFLADDRLNTSMESYSVAAQEAIVCGVGAWELYTEYVSNRSGDNTQVIRRRPLHEANNNLFWDSNAERIDKSDADHCGYLTPYSAQGYIDLVKELTGEELTQSDISSFGDPEQSYTFPWVGSNNEWFYVVTFYHREKVKDKILTFLNPFGEELPLRESDLEDVMDDMLESGFEIINEKDIERWQVMRYIASGAEILEAVPVAGENIPVIPVYGERQFVEGEEHYEGITRLAKDPQRLRNFNLSYLADLTSRSPRPKPFFFPEQIQGFESYLQESGIDSNYPYFMLNRVTGSGEDLPPGPAGMMPGPEIPQGVMQCIEESRMAVADVAGSGPPQDIADPDLSGKAVRAIQAQIDKQNYVYQDHMKYAKRRDGEVYASMAVDVYDAPRQVRVTKPDGTTDVVYTMEAVMDDATGELKILNDLSNMEFDVYAEIGRSYTSKRDETVEQLRETAAIVAPFNPNLANILIMKQVSMMEGVQMEDIRDYLRKEMIVQGITKPETDEEKQMMAQLAQGQNKPDPAMVLAQAEQTKAQADLVEQQRLYAVDGARAQNDAAKTQIDAFQAQTNRAKVQVDAAKAGAEIDYKRLQGVGQAMDNRAKRFEQFSGRLNRA